MVETAANSNAQKVILFIDNQFIDTLNIPNNNSTTIFENSPTYILPSLDEGLHTLRVQYVVSNPDFRIKDFHFSLVNPCVTSNTIDVEPIDTFNIYPNPASTYLTIETSGNETMNVELLDMSGRLVFTTQLTDKKTIDISKLSPSVYFIKLIGSQGTAVKRWVKELIYLSKCFIHFGFQKKCTLFLVQVNKAGLSKNFIARGYCAVK
jgi:hypothetical protein